MRNREQIISLIETDRRTLKNQGVKAIGLFGSYATNQATEKSDLDFVVRLEKKRLMRT
jgi:predicted nucleotidyltransferase